MERETCKTSGPAPSLVVGKRENKLVLGSREFGGMGRWNEEDIIFRMRPNPNVVIKEELLSEQDCLSMSCADMLGCGTYPEGSTMQNQEKN